MFWQFLPVAIVLYAAMLVHAGLGIWALYERRQFRWKAIEPLQLVLGLSIPALIVAHVVGAGLGYALFGHAKFYPQVLYAFWVARPYKIWLMSGVLIIAWVHGSIGLYFWLRMKAFFRRAAPFLLAAAVLVPTLALLGFIRADAPSQPPAKTRIGAPTILLNVRWGPPPSKARWTTSPTIS
jgi:adenylate cyclase